MTAWLRSNWVTAASAILTLLTVFNGAYHWLPGEVVVAVWACVAPFGVRSLLAGNGQAAVAEEKVNAAHDRIDRLELNAGILPHLEERSDVIRYNRPAEPPKGA